MGRISAFVLVAVVLPGAARADATPVCEEVVAGDWLASEDVGLEHWLLGEARQLSYDGSVGPWGLSLTRSFYQVRWGEPWSRSLRDRCGTQQLEAVRTGRPRARAFLECLSPSARTTSPLQAWLRELEPRLAPEDERHSVALECARSLGERLEHLETEVSGQYADLVERVRLAARWSGPTSERTLDALRVLLGVAIPNCASGRECALAEDLAEHIAAIEHATGADASSSAALLFLFSRHDADFAVLSRLQDYAGGALHGTGVQLATMATARRASGDPSAGAYARLALRALPERDPLRVPMHLTVAEVERAIGASDKVLVHVQAAYRLSRSVEIPERELGRVYESTAGLLMSLGAFALADHEAGEGLGRISDSDAEARARLLILRARARLETSRVDAAARDVWRARTLLRFSRAWGLRARLAVVEADLAIETRRLHVAQRYLRRARRVSARAAEAEIEAEVLALHAKSAAAQRAPVSRLNELARELRGSCRRWKAQGRAGEVAAACTGAALMLVQSLAERRTARWDHIADDAREMAGWSARPEVLRARAELWRYLARRSLASRDLSAARSALEQAIRANDQLWSYVRSLDAWISRPDAIDELLVRVRDEVALVSTWALQTSDSDAMPMLAELLLRREGGWRTVADGRLPDLDRVRTALGDAALVQMAELDLPTREGQLVRRYAVVILQGGRPAELVPLGAADRIDRDVGRLLSALRRGRSSVVAPAMAVYESLVAPWRDLVLGSESWVVVPTGRLRELPLGALHDGTGWLAERVRLRYAFAATSVAVPAREPIPVRRLRALVLADPDYATSSQPPTGRCLPLRRLPGTRLEADSLRLSLEREGAQAIVYVGADATEGHFRRALSSEPAIIHVGAHGLYVGEGVGGHRLCSHGRGALPNIDDPLSLSAIVLATSPRDEHDGVLTAAEVSELSFDQTRLAVLAACDAGRNRAERGLGVLGFASTLLTRGAETVIAPLWEVDDHVTRHFMAELYRGILAGLPRDEALDRAMESVRRRNPDPSAWAAFVAYGASGSVVRVEDDR